MSIVCTKKGGSRKPDSSSSYQKNCASCPFLVVIRNHPRIIPLTPRQSLLDHPPLHLHPQQLLHPPQQYLLLWCLPPQYLLS